MRAIRVVIVIVGLTGGQLAAQAPVPDTPAAPFPPPGGVHAIGTDDWLWTDERRGEPYTRNPDDRRRLPIRVWYPAQPAAGAATAPYVLAPDEFGANNPYQPVAHARTNAVVGAPVARAERPFPVLIYNPGGGASRFSATFITEALASHGYVVFGVDHPGPMGRTVLFSNGTPFAPDTLAMPAPDPADMKATEARTTGFLDAVVFPIWLDDSRFVLDCLMELNAAPGPFQGKLDLDRIGMLGWSFGGAAAVELARTDLRVKAAVNHDGRLFGGAMREPIGRPFMLFHHGIDDVAAAPPANREVMRDVFGRIRAIDDSARRRATADWYDITIARTNHGHFADLPLFLPQFRDTTLLAGPRGHEIITAYTLAFFDRHLKGRDSPLLAKPSAEYPEVSFRRR